MARAIDSVSTMRLGRMSNRQFIIAMSNIALWAMAMLLAQSNWSSQALVRLRVPENHWVSPSSTFTDTPIASKRWSRTYSSVVTLERLYCWL